MSAVVLQIADAMVAEINAASLEQTVEAQRFYVPVYDLQKDLGSLKVSVVPKEIPQVQMMTRHSDDFTYNVDVAVQQKLPATAIALPDIIAFCDPLMLLMEQIIDLFRGKPLAAVPGVECMGVANPFLYAPDMLDEVRVFTSIATLTFKLVRDRP